MEEEKQIDVSVENEAHAAGGILSDLNERRDARATEKKRRKKLAKQISLPILGVLIFIFVLNIIILPLTGSYARSGAVDSYNGDNQYIAIGTEKGTLLSAHRAGGDIAPEETMAAFKNCMESTNVDIVEFDLHLTKDGYLVLMHDHEVDRTSDGSIKFGKKGVKIQDKTLAELKTLNFGYNFKNLQGEYPYRDLAEDEIPDDVRILELSEILTYLKSVRGNDLTYIIEIKDKGKIGKRAMDKLYEAMVEYDILDKTIVGTFNGDISKYIDDKYSKQGVKRSAGILEVLNFYYAFLWGVKQDPDKLNYDVLQIPMGLDGFFDFSTKAFIDYAHSLGIAVQYWTINDEDDMRTLLANGADAIMTDNPQLAREVLDDMNEDGSIRFGKQQQ
ncbi:MAG: hypothetical protein NC037_06185 [Bacteroides sp.]|nr:hypothetical protein [Bacillota bacterium]MCM1393609.1 hypothetical protein [[Eubacterium] siraeum]MCM1456093.1 hypothetical protein [Bacteroides sp.]